jgi:hypothetical protein
MPRHAHYIEWEPDLDESNRAAESEMRDVDVENPFEDPEVRQRMAELIARAARRTKRTGR